MALCGCHVVDAAVAVLVVLPAHEIGRPLAGLLQVVKPQDGNSGRYLRIRLSTKGLSKLACGCE